MYLRHLTLYKTGSLDWYRHLCNTTHILHDKKGATRRVDMCQPHSDHAAGDLLYLHLSLNREGRWGTTDDFTTIPRPPSNPVFLCFPAPSWTWRTPGLSIPWCCLPISSSVCLAFFPPLTVPCKMFLTWPDERQTWPYHCSLRLFTMVKRSSCGPIASWILARPSSLETWSSYKIRSILRYHLISMAFFFFFLQLCCEGLWFSIQEDGCNKGTHQSYLETEGNALVIPN